MTEAGGGGGQRPTLNSQSPTYLKTLQISQTKIFFTEIDYCKIMFPNILQRSVIHMVVVVIHGN